MKSQLLGFIVLAFMLLVALDVNGQTTGTGGGTTTGGNASGGNTTGGNTAGGNASGGNTTSTGTAAASATDGLSPTTAFTQLSNSGVGASADTVRGLNTTSVAAGTGTSTTGGRGGGGLGGLGSFGLGGFGASGFGQGFGSSTPAKPTLRTRLRSNIDVAPLASQQIQSSAQSRFYQTPQTSRLRGVQVNMVEGTAVINGVVGSEKDRRMSELLMRLEPGVRRVNNQVTVSP